jgi:hypothetical protein
MEDSRKAIIASVKELLKDYSDKAIDNGKRFRGFMGVNPDELDREDLICLCNVLYNSLWERKTENLKTTL